MSYVKGNAFCHLPMLCLWVFIVVCMYVNQCVDCVSVYGICMLKLFLSFNNQYNMKRKFKKPHRNDYIVQLLRVHIVVSFY